MEEKTSTHYVVETIRASELKRGDVFLDALHGVPYEVRSVYDATHNGKRCACVVTVECVRGRVEQRVEHYMDPRAEVLLCR